MTTIRKNGFVIPRQTARLVFENEYAGAEVVVSLNFSFGLLLEAQRLAGNEADPAMLESLLRRFTDEALVSWNLVDEDGEPIPSHPDGLLHAPMPFVNRVISETAAAVGQIPDPLESRSNNGTTKDK
jgi:hypothetical protein